MDNITTDSFECASEKKLTSPKLSQPPNGHRKGIEDIREYYEKGKRKCHQDDGNGMMALEDGNINILAYMSTYHSCIETSYTEVLMQRRMLPQHQRFCN